MTFKLAQSVLVAILVSLPPMLAAQDEAPIEPSELIGFWKMVPLPDPSKNRVDPWPMPYQWFGFYDDGSLVSMGTTEFADHNAKDLQELFTLAKRGAPHYHWQQGFLIVEYPDAPGSSEMWGMNLFRNDVPRVGKGIEILSGDLIMSLAGEDGRPVHFRHLRRLK